jgi:serine/threonine protein kinase
MPLLSPISTGFLLENRYEVTQFLGYGGFGRTYLARDRQRFNEICVLKEFAPQINSPEVLRKAEELFRREAGTLYQLRHEQIPEFRATLAIKIDGQDVLLIVEQYIAGQTYEQWVEGGDRLDESGAMQFLRDLLPVLTYIHTRGVVHRDISPDNLILEKNSRKPFLIDFGSVRQVATTAMQMSGMATATQIHKPGFSPREQLRGEVSPSTDLYSLAVTTLVLVTGRSPLELYDDQVDQWHWRQFVRFNPTLERLLDQMLATRITDRIPSAMAAMQILESIGGLPGLAPGDLAPYIPPQPIVNLPHGQPQTISPQPISPQARYHRDNRDQLSQMQTVAIAPADPQPTQAFPTTYPQRRGEMQVSDQPEFYDQRRDRQIDQPEEDWLWSLVKLPGRILMWVLKGLWMGIKAIDWVMTWVWRAILIVMLLAGGAVASYLWKTGQEKVAQVEEQVRSPQVPGIPNLKFPEIQLPELKMPELKMPNIEVPELKMPQIPQWNVTKSKNCAETIARFEQSGLSKQQFYGSVDKNFRAKHPELAGRGLTDAPEDAPLRQEWCAIADQVLNEAMR